MDTAPAPELSFIVPAHDEAGFIEECLESIHSAARSIRRPHEVIVVCDACDDDTPERAREAGARVIEVDHRQIARTRNSGAQHARGEKLIFVDADTRTDEGVLREAVDALDGGAKAGGAPARFDGDVPRTARVLRAAQTAVFRLGRFTGGCHQFAQRDAFFAVGGYDERLFAGEDMRLAKAIKRRYSRRAFAVLDRRVETSARKFRALSVREYLACAWRLVAGPRAVRKREDLGVWYGPPRSDRFKPSA